MLKLWMETNNKNGHTLTKQLKSYINLQEKQSQQESTRIFNMTKKYFNKKWLYKNKSYNQRQKNKLKKKVN